MVATNVKANRLSFGDDLSVAVRSADAVFLAVGTPSRRGDGHAVSPPLRRHLLRCNGYGVNRPYKKITEFCGLLAAISIGISR